MYLPLSGIEIWFLIVSGGITYIVCALIFSKSEDGGHNYGFTLGPFLAFAITSGVVLIEFVAIILFREEIRHLIMLLRPG